jgi:hypothetical protein
MSVEVHYPLVKEEKTCGNCSQPATSVINGNPQCNACAGRRIIDEFPEILGDLLAQKLRQG